MSSDSGTPGCGGNISRLELDCYGVGSLDYNLLVEINGVSIKHTKVQLFAEGSTATK